MNDQTTLTVYQATYDLLRKLGLTTIFGNPGSTEQPFLKNFPSDFEYILGLQEASAVAMADGFAQATKRPALLNLHTSAGTGHGMGNIMTAYQNKTPLIITAGQQAREMVLCDPYLTNRDETTLPRPWVKWAYQPVRAQDVPGALMRAYAVALQPPAGPVYVSIPLTDWDQPALGEAVVRTVSSRYAPDPDRIALFADRIRKSQNPVLIYGPEIERSGGWHAGIKFAERLNAPVYLAPLADRASFPQTHPQFRGMVPIAIGPLSKKLAGHDLIIVVGAQVFRYYPYIAGDYLPKGTDLLQITNDPYDAAAAIVGDSLLADASLALEALADAIPEVTLRSVSSRADIERTLPAKPHNPLTALEAFTALGDVRPANAILVNETASNFADLLQNWPIVEPESYYTFASGGLGWGAPAAVGIAIAQKKQGTGRPVIAAIGDGALQYSVQSLYTAAQQKLKLIFVVPCNDEYAILKNFAVLENTPNVPALDLPGLDIVATANAFGCIGVAANTAEEIKQAFTTALDADGPTVIAIRIARQMRSLVPDAD
ncbi:benzoylformate decarboxylase [Terriglobus albidus]|uniref:Benzoylformate decarboxylase n=1 Tax=Terriglobus albidus TaxID=1592106 RepID=A0A5B9EFQ3_9BACT|nr:benzoylformate decarboxylase [Terriglobus albidus]QEE28876.1 benzoylformate decarboxylase [Terriglobus albidus]